MRTMSAFTSCSVPPRLTSWLIGPRNEPSTAWNASSMPTVICPSMTRMPPSPRMRVPLTAIRNGGTDDSNMVVSSKRCSALTTLAWKPAQRAKKSDSAPLALMVSMVCRAPIETPSSLALSCCSCWVSVVRLRDT